MKSLRASAGQRALVCPASIAESSEAPDFQSDRSQLGNAFHEVMERLANHQPLDTAISDAALTYDVSDEELRPLVRTDQFEPLGGEAEVEVIYTTANGVKVPGHIDLVKVQQGLPAGVHDYPEGMDVEWAQVVDYKTTLHPEKHVKIDRSVTMATYSLAVMKEFGVAITCPTYYFPHGKGTDESPIFEWTWITPRNRDSIKAWVDGVWDRAAEQAKIPPGQRIYHPNNYSAATSCSYCPGRATCHGLRWRAAADINTLGGDPALPTSITSTEDVIALWRLIELSTTRAKAEKGIKDMLTSWFEKQQRTVPLYERGGAWAGKELYLEVNSRGAKTLRVRTIENKLENET